jgi:hypothetical protein
MILRIVIINGLILCIKNRHRINCKNQESRMRTAPNEIQLKSVDNRFSEVLAGSLKIRGVLRQAWWNPVGKSIFWVDENDETPGAIQEALFRADSRRSSSKQAEDDESVPYYSFRAQHDESGDWPPMQVFFIPILAHEKTVSMGLLLIKSEKKNVQACWVISACAQGKV